jgi:hypothetical protein
MLEMVADAASVTHSARCDYDVKAGELSDRFTFFYRLGEPEMR